MTDRTLPEQQAGDPDAPAESPQTTEGEAGKPPPLSSAFKRLWGSAATSNLADGILGVSVTLVTAQITSSATLIAGLRIARSVPDALAALPAGALADRYDRRKIMVGVNVLRGAAFGLLAVAAFLDMLSLPVLYVVVGLMGMAEVMVDTAAQSVVPGLVARDRLGAANSRLYGTQVAMHEFVGGPFGGLLVAIAAGAAFGVPAALYVLAGIILLTLPGRYKPVRQGPTRMREDVREGLSIVLRNPLLRMMIIMTALLNLANTAYYSIFVLFAVGEDSAMGLSEAGYGLLFATLAGGAVAASFVNERLERRLGRVALIRIGVIGCAAAFLVPVATTNPVAVGAAFFTAAFVMMLYRVAFTSIRQALTPDELLGRVGASFRVVLLSTIPLGALMGGLVGDLVGLRAVFVACALVSLAAAAGFPVVTRRNLERAERDGIRAQAPASGGKAGDGGSGGPDAPEGQ